MLNINFAVFLAWIIHNIIAEGSPDDIKQKIWDFRDYILDGFDDKVLDIEDEKF